MLLDRTFGRKIVDDYIVLLAKPVYPADPLLYPHRVPGEVEVDHMVAELQIDPFAACFRSNHYLGAPAEEVHHPVLLPRFIPPE